MPKRKLTVTGIILIIVVLSSFFLASCTNQPVEIRNAVEAKDVALSYLADKYDDNVPAEDLEWKEYMTTAEELVGSGTKQFISGDWLVTISYPIILPENTVYNIVVLNIETGWHWEGSVGFDGTVTEINTLEQLTKEGSQDIALEFIKQSPTFIFDGIEETLKFTNDIAISIPFTWTFVFQFDSAHAGYGDRTGKMLAEVITPHEVSITVEQGKIVYASMDNKWNMINQTELSVVDPNDVIVTEEPDIIGMITDIETVSNDIINGRILVELDQPNNTSDKFWVTIEKNTLIYEYDGQDHYTIPFDTLQKGQVVEVWFSGPVKESYPAQVNAEYVLVIQLMDYNNFVDSLRAAGAMIESSTLPQVIVQDFFSVTGQVFKMNGEDVQVFEYSSQAKAEKEAALVSADGSSIGTSIPFWVAPPHFYQAGKIIVLYVGENTEVMDLLEKVLGQQFAGL